MRVEIELPEVDVHAIDDFAFQADTTRDRVVHWAVSQYFRLEDRRLSMAAHPAQGQRQLRSA
jgi:hypothetical protein